MRLVSLAVVVVLGCCAVGRAQDGEREQKQKQDKGKQKTPVLLDTDFGSYLDDACALALLLASPEIELKAITTTGGDTEDRAWMVCRMLKMVDRLDIPVAWGRDPQPKGEVKELYQYRYHPAVLYNRTGKPSDKDAADLLYEKLKEQPKGETVLLAIGPLTNVARLLEKHPDSKEMLKRIVVLGGELRKGREPEWNVAQDVKAARVVFGSDVPLVLVPFQVAERVQFSRLQQDTMFSRPTMLAQQLETLRQLSNPGHIVFYDVAAVGFLLDDALTVHDPLRLTVGDDGALTPVTGKGNTHILFETNGFSMAEEFQDRLKAFGKEVQPRELANISKPVERGNLPASVHAFEDYETDIEKRWWLAGRLLTADAPQGKRAFRSVLTLDFDDKQGDLNTMYSAVVFNPVPGPPMGPKTRLSFRYRLHGTDQLRVQLYSLSNGYHRYLALKDLPQDSWQEATVDMTDMRRPDGSGGALAEDERIDDIQFYVAPTARVDIDDVILYDAAPEGEKEPFPKRIIFTGWFDTGKQGVEWPGDYEIVEHEKPRKWKAAKAVMKEDFLYPSLTISFRGARPVGEITKARFKYRVMAGARIKLALLTEGGFAIPATVKVGKAGEWQEGSAQFKLDIGLDESQNTPSQKFDRLHLYVTDDAGRPVADADLMIDDLLVYEPATSK